MQALTRLVVFRFRLICLYFRFVEIKVENNFAGKQIFICVYIDICF